MFSQCCRYKINILPKLGGRRMMSAQQVRKARLNQSKGQRMRRGVNALRISADTKYVPYYLYTSYIPPMGFPIPRDLPKSTSRYCNRPPHSCNNRTSKEWLEPIESTVNGSSTYN